MIDPDKGEWLYHYNDFGELVQQRDANLQTTTMTYDVLGRMETRVDKDTRDNQQSTTDWLFNAANDLPTSINHSSTLEGATGVETSTHNTAFGYDSFGRGNARTVTINSRDPVTESTTFDQYGRVFQTFNAAGNDSGVEHGYNPYGYLDQIKEAQIVNGGQALYVHYQAMNPWGKVTQEALGNGLTTQRDYDLANGRLMGIYTDMSGLAVSQDWLYSYDALGNLETKTNLLASAMQMEAYCYDDLNRLVGSALGASCANDDNVYDDLGNIIKKGAVDDYVYGTGNTNAAEDAGPHAVVSAGGVNYFYDNNGNMTDDTSGRVLSYTVFDKPYSISKGADIRIDFRYGASRARYRRIDTDGSSTTTTHYVGNLEFIDRNGVEEIKRYVAGYMVQTQTVGTNYWAGQYMLKDHLGSTDVLVDAVGRAEQTMSFDAWGQRRSATDLISLLDTASWQNLNLNTTRGFTGHEMLDAVGLIHMNGRIYDPRLGRFLQADPFIQFAHDTQSYNRYSYVLNNPLKYTDPSGHFVFTLAAAIYLAVAEGVKWYVVGMVMAAAGAMDALSQGATLSQALRAGIIQGVSAAAFAGVGNAGFSQFGEFANVAKVGAFGAVGGITSVLQGGKFGHGFVSAGIGAMVGVDWDRHRLEKPTIAPEYFSANPV